MLRLITRGFQKKKKLCQTTPKLLDKYTIIKELGTGGTSVVYKVMDNDTYTYYTCKSLTEKLDVKGKREVIILKKIPKSLYFPQLIETINGDNSQYNIITEYIPGTDLFDWLVATIKGKELLDEDIVKKIFKNMVIITCKLHSLGFVHLDIKLENFILRSSTDYGLTLIDLASVHPHRPHGSVSCVVGTRGYSPYEVFKGGYSPTSDVWNLGVCLWILITGVNAFSHRELDYGRHAVTRRSFKFPTKKHEIHKHLMSKDAFDLVEKMLIIDPKRRLPVDKILDHPWFQ